MNLSSSLSLSSSSLYPRIQEEAQDPFVLTANKLGISPEFLRSKFQELEKFYETTQLSTIVGVTIIRNRTPLNGSSIRLEEILEEMEADQAEIREAFTYQNTYQSTGDIAICTVKFRGEILGISSPHISKKRPPLAKDEKVPPTNEELAKEEASMKALQVLNKHPLYFEKFLVPTPEITDNNNLVIELQEFCKKHAPTNTYKDGDLIFEKNETGCYMVFKKLIKIPIEDIKKEDPQHTRHRKGLIALFRFLNRSVQMPKEIYFKNIRNEILNNSLLPFVPKVLVALIQDYANDKNAGEYRTLDLLKEPEVQKKSEPKMIES